MDARSVIVRPIVSERSFEMIEQGRYTFEVDKRATKPQIAAAVTEIFGVTVTKVNTMNVSGKPRRLRAAKGITRSWKKAVVSLKEGDSIEFFEGH
ncbi:MAG: 50S ribosomal protein L23 [Actinobacteria bacterium HGW-Actinobacteria-9]|jgi:large subunit ribosomal protein L23|nr:MAG: 50S ribosomal protein L23 [Actinobacteria bacterium HGW-Actinobacteria-9]